MYEKLDIVSIMIGWEFRYLLVMVHALDRGVLNHTLLLRDTRTPYYTGITK